MISITSSRIAREQEFRHPNPCAHSALFIRRYLKAMVNSLAYHNSATQQIVGYHEPQFEISGAVALLAARAGAACRASDHTTRVQQRGYMPLAIVIATSGGRRTSVPSESPWF
jgi:hypothetical protein